MNLMSIIGVLIPALFLIAIVGFVLCLVSLVKAIRGQRKIPFFSIATLIVPVIVIFLSKHFIISELESSANDESTNVSTTPAVEYDAKVLLRNALSNLYQNKGKSGSHPTNKKYVFDICHADECFTAIAAQDSRDSSMYWLSYQAVIGSIPLGFTQITDEKI